METKVIRKSKLEDLDRIMEIYAYAREFMAATGNPRQWGSTNWPPKDRILQDIEGGNGYVCEVDGKVEGVFYFIHGEDIDPTYRKIEGEWIGDDTYGVVHRIASSGNVPGIGACCINWAIEQCGHLRIDTHTDNKPMQKLLLKLGFKECGIIHVLQDNDPRIAFEYL